MNSKPIILIAAAALISATACDRDVESTVQPQHVTFTLSFDGAAAPATRATYDGLTGVWEVGDEVYVYLTSTDNVSYGPYTFTPDAAGERATFQAEITGIPDGTRIASIDAYHYDNLDAVAFDNGTISYSLPAAADGTLSYITVSSYDYPSGSEPAASEGGTIDITEALTFTHCLSRIDIETDIPNIRDVTIGIVGGSFPSSGRIDVADGVTTAAATTALLHATPSDNFQIGIIPVDFGGDRKLRAVVVTTDGKAYTREVTVSQFARATRYTLQLNAANLTEATAIADEQAFTDISNGNYILTADLTLTEIPHITDFSGTIDGNGHTIDISTAAATTSGQGGIFATTTGDTSIRNMEIIAGDREATISEGGVLVGGAGRRPVARQHTCLGQHYGQPRRRCQPPFRRRHSRIRTIIGADKHHQLDIHRIGHHRPDRHHEHNIQERLRRRHSRMRRDWRHRLFADGLVCRHHRRQRIGHKRLHRNRHRTQQHQ